MLVLVLVLFTEAAVCENKWVIMGYSNSIIPGALLRTRILSMEEKKYKRNREEVRQKLYGLESELEASIHTHMHMYVCVCVCVLALSTEKAWKLTSSGAVSTLSTQVLVLRFFLIKRQNKTKHNSATWRNAWFQVWGQEMYKTNPEYLAISDNKGTIKDY